MLLVLVALLTPAHAAQPGPATAFNGTWDLSCEQASLSLHLGFAGGDGQGEGGWGDTLDIDLDCDGVSADDEAALAAALADRCEAAGLPAAVCADVAGDVAAAVAAFNDDAVALLPSAVTLRVGSYGWFWSGLLGLYPMTGAHTFTEGVRSWTYLLDNNAGDRGHFAAAGLAINGGGAEGYLACVDASVAAIDGRVRADLGYTLDAEAAVDRSLYCLASDGEAWLTGSVGVSFTSSVSGVRR